MKHIEKVCTMYWMVYSDDELTEAANDRIMKHYINRGIIDQLTGLDELYNEWKRAGVCI